MAFHFTLAAVLRFRQSMEQHEYFALETLQHQARALEKSIKQVMQAISGARHSRERHLAEGIQAADLHSTTDYEQGLDQQLAAFEKQLAQTRLRWRNQLQVYQAARRRRETLDKLRSDQLDAYRREQSKREQSTIDDLFRSRRRPRE